MIKKLYIKNYILIDELSLDFKEGLNAITGETGAGKSIIINAIDYIFAPRLSKEIIKDDTKKTLLEITISNNSSIQELLNEQGIDDIGDEVVISKEISTTSLKTRLNGTLVNNEVLKLLKEKVIDIHSQHQTYAFMQPKYHIHWLDNYAKETYRELLEEYQEKYKNYKKLCSDLEEAKEKSNVTESQVDFLMFQINEIEAANIENTDEYEELKQEASVLENAEKLKELTASSYWAIKGDDGSISEVLGKIGTNLDKARTMDENLKDISEDFINAVELLNETANNIRDYSQNLDNNTERLNEVQERLFLLDKLRRKYGSTLEEILETYDKLKFEYDNIENSSKNIDKLNNEIQKTLKELEILAEKISEKRKEFATILSNLIVEKLANLELPKARFKIDVQDCELNKDGKNKVEFMISTNISEDLKPLSKVASGGEISRVMLGIKSIFAESDNIETVVFDEIDTGISGKASQSVAEELAELSKYHQIILITHQPIIASKANHFFYVNKKQDETTAITVKTLNEANKIEAIAELASGEITEQSIEFAKSLICN